MSSTKVRGEFHNITQYKLGLGIGFTGKEEAMKARFSQISEDGKAH